VRPRWKRSWRPLPRRHGVGRRVHHERPVRRRHAPARHLSSQAAYHEGERLAFACTVCHHIDSAAGSRVRTRPIRTRSMPEGCASAPMKLYRGGALKKTHHRRSSRRTSACLRPAVPATCVSQLAACHIGEKPIRRDRSRAYGPQQTKADLKEVIDYSERLTRAALRNCPTVNGASRIGSTTTAVDYGAADPDFSSPSARQGITWWSTGPAPTRRSSAINNTLSFTKAASYTGVRSVCRRASQQRGRFRRIEVICPPGTVGNGVLPAACPPVGSPGFRMVDCMSARSPCMLHRPAVESPPAMARQPPDHLDRRATTPTATLRLCRLSNCGALGRAAVRPTGSTAIPTCPKHGLGTRSRSPSAEQPIQLLAYEFVADKAGASGKFRAGVPFLRDYRSLSGRHLQCAPTAARSPAVRPVRRQALVVAYGRTISTPTAAEPAAAFERLTRDQKGRHLPPPAGRRRRLGRSAGARLPQGQCCATCARALVPERPWPTTGVVIDLGAWDGRTGPDRPDDRAGDGRCPRLDRPFPKSNGTTRCCHGAARVVAP